MDLIYLTSSEVTIVVTPCRLLRRGSGREGADLFCLVSKDRMYGNGSKLSQGRFRFVIRKHFFSERLLIHRNRLPREVVKAPGLSVFKRYLDDDLTMFCNFWSALGWSGSWMR